MEEVSINEWKVEKISVVSGAAPGSWYLVCVTGMVFLQELAQVFGAQVAKASGARIWQVCFSVALFWWSNEQHDFRFCCHSIASFPSELHTKPNESAIHKDQTLNIHTAPNTQHLSKLQREGS